MTTERKQQKIDVLDLSVMFQYLMHFHIRHTAKTNGPIVAFLYYSSLTITIIILFHSYQYCLFCHDTDKKNYSEQTKPEY